MQTRIQELRKERRITQNELADAVNVTRQTIISLENGKYNASLVLAHKLAQFFNVAIEGMFIFDVEEENLSTAGKSKDCYINVTHVPMRNTGQS